MQSVLPQILTAPRGGRRSRRRGPGDDNNRKISIHGFVGNRNKLLLFSSFLYWILWETEGVFIRLSDVKSW